MKCSNCGGYVEWKGRLSNLTHTECSNCGGTNTQIPEDDETEDDETEECEFGILSGNRCRRKATLITRTGYKCCDHHYPHEGGIPRKDVKPIEQQTP